MKKGVWDQKWAWHPKMFCHAKYSQPPHLQRAYTPEVLILSKTNKCGSMTHLYVFGLPLQWLQKPAAPKPLRKSLTTVYPGHWSLQLSYAETE